MPNYKLGKIYRLRIGDLVYIGSTTQPMLSLRLGQHKTAYKRWVNVGKQYVSSFELFQVGTPTIELIEIYPCGSKDELRAREGHHQRATDCVNIRIECQSSKEYYVANQSTRCEYQRNYYYSDPDRHQDYHKQYYQDHQDSLRDYSKKYYVANRKRILEYNRIRNKHNRRVEVLTLFIQNHVQSI
jgi:hypothetical protein